MILGFRLRIYHRGFNGYTIYKTVDCNLQSSTKLEVALVHEDGHFSVLLNKTIKSQVIDHKYQAMYRTRLRYTMVFGI